MEDQENKEPTLTELWTLVQKQQAQITDQAAEITTLKVKAIAQQENVLPLQHVEKEAGPASLKQRISRATLLKAAVASMVGITTVALAGTHEASAAPAAPLTTIDTNFVATGSATASVGFDASSQTAAFNYGVEAYGTVSGVYGTSTDGYAVRGESTNNDGVIGVTNSNNAIAGVRGIARASGYGGWFQAGGGAGIPLHLEPALITGHPTFGNFLKGDIFVDTNGTIWVCIATGNPGEWKKILTHS